MHEPIPSRPLQDTSDDAGVGRDATSPDHDEWLLDEALMETFPASDPVCPATEPTTKNGPRGRTPR